MRASLFAAGFFFPGKFFLFPATLRCPRCHSRTGVVSVFQREDYHLLRWPQFRSERQNLLHGSQPVRELWIQGHTFQLVANTQPHQVVTRKLRNHHLEAVSSTAEVKLDLIDYVTAKMPFTSPRQQVSVIAEGIERELSSLFQHY